MIELTGRGIVLRRPVRHKGNVRKLTAIDFAVDLEVNE
jgi:hypothetical protein